jgi:hypothetical protein
MPTYYNRVETEREIPKLKFVSIKLKPKDVESSSIGTALGSYRNYTQGVYCQDILFSFSLGIVLQHYCLVGSAHLL